MSTKPICLPLRSKSMLVRAVDMRATLEADVEGSGELDESSPLRLDQMVGSIGSLLPIHFSESADSEPSTPE